MLGMSGRSARRRNVPLERSQSRHTVLNCGWTRPAGPLRCLARSAKIAESQEKGRVRRRTRPEVSSV